MTETEWVACADPGRMLEFRPDQASTRKQLLFAVACCRRVGCWLTDARSRKAVEVAEQYAEGLASAGEFQVAGDDAWDASALDYEAAEAGSPVSAWYAARAAAAATEPVPGQRLLVTAWAAGAAAATDGLRWTDPAWESTLRAAWVARAGEDNWDAYGWDAVYELGGDAFTGYPGWVAERKHQAMLVRDLFGNPFRPVAFPAGVRTWNHAAVVRLAQAAYDSRDLPAGTLDIPRLAVLADALEEAGCTDTDLLGHLRGPGPHVRGCFAVDSILGRT